MTLPHASTRSLSRSTLRCAGRTARIGSSSTRQTTTFAHELPGTWDTAAISCVVNAGGCRNAVNGTRASLRNWSSERGLIGPSEPTNVGISTPRKGKNRVHYTLIGCCRIMLLRLIHSWAEKLCRLVRRSVLGRKTFQKTEY